jgi:hypothetical protein
MLPPLDQLHPTSRALLEHWQRIHPPGGGLPGRQHFDPTAIPRLLPNVWLVDVASPTDSAAIYRFRYRVMGTAMVEAGAPARTGDWLHESVPEPEKRQRMEQFMIQAVETRAPNWRRGAPTIYHNRHISELEVLSLPLARDGATVDALLSATVFYWRD